jgi:phosphatidate cytidylyltransferase
MLAKRLLVVIVLLPIGIIAIYYGGWVYAAMISLFCSLSAWEYSQLMRHSGLQPAQGLVIGGTLALLLQRQLDGFQNSPLVLSALILIGMTVHLVAFERGRNQAATDFTVTLAGIFYLGWIGSYLISLRSLPDGRWWTLLALSAVWVADGMAYAAGKRWGRHLLSPRLSPKKTWEGYWGSLVGGLAMGAFLGWLFSLLGAGTTAWSGVWLGLVMGGLPTLGDLGESMLKRQAGVKDSGNLLPGHGGMFDRIDSWLWAGVISYYLITWLWL